MFVTSELSVIDRINDLSARSSTLLISTVLRPHRPWEHEYGQSKEKGGLQPSLKQFMVIIN